MEEFVQYHNPDYAERLPSGVPMDIMLSGHTHGGQVCLPNGHAPHIPSRYGNKYRAGLVQGRRTRVYISRGVASSHRIRFCCHRRFPPLPCADPPTHKGRAA